jgi:deoxyribodipyrimidine photolyase
VRFVLDSLADLAAAVEDRGSHLALSHGGANETVLRAARAARADAVYWNDEYEPQLVRRDATVESTLRREGIAVRRFHDRLLVPPGTVATKQGKPFVVYTPFRRACEALPLSEPLPRVRRFAAHDLPRRTIASLGEPGFTTAQTPWPGGAKAAKQRLRTFLSRGLARYETGRDRAGRRRHGAALGRPQVRHPLAADRDALVDTGMRELAATGFMHNRVPMVVAPFLTKDLLLDCGSASGTSCGSWWMATWRATTAVGSGPPPAPPGRNCAPGPGT